METSALNCSGKSLRMHRLMNGYRRGVFLVPLDHSVSDGPVCGSRGVPATVELMSANGVDGVVLHKGQVRFLDVDALQRLTLVVHLSASTRHAPDVNRKILVCEVDEALRCGADAVSVHVNLGSDSESEQLGDFARVGEHCADLGVPLLAMVYPRGPRIQDHVEPELIAHAASLATDLGADVVKVPFTGGIDTMADVVAGCPLPLLVAGGGLVDSHATLHGFVADVMKAGAAGVAIGRNVFQATDPAQAASSIASLVHGASPALVP